MNLGKTILELRKQKNVTQEDLAAELGVTAAAVSKWENGYTLPDVLMLCALADYFQVTTDELLGLEKKTIHEAEVVEQPAVRAEAEDDGGQGNSWEFKLDNGRRGSLGMAVLVLLVGGLLLAGQILNWNIIAWLCL